MEGSSCALRQFWTAPCSRPGLGLNLETFVLVAFSHQVSPCLSAREVEERANKIFSNQYTTFLLLCKNLNICYSIPLSPHWLKSPSFSFLPRRPPPPSTPASQPEPCGEIRKRTSSLGIRNTDTESNGRRSEFTSEVFPCSPFLV